jgi:hypothetical protein
VVFTNCIRVATENKYVADSTGCSKWQKCSMSASVAQISTNKLENTFGKHHPSARPSLDDYDGHI